MFFKRLPFIAFSLSMMILISTAICHAVTPGREEPIPSSGTEGNIRFFQSASGYCPQTGGSTNYESVSSASLENLSDGKTMRLVVHIYIANPMGCTAGNPCPSYDSSPEYVNAWIDFNGDQTFSSDEKVMSASLSGYANINYSGTMTAVRQFEKPVGHVESTYMRVNVGYNHNPTDPCESSWTWGNSVDYPVELGPSDEQPQFESIQITPEPPLAGENVKFEAIIPNADKFEDLEIHWGFFDNSGTGNPYEYSTSKGLEGHGKKVGHVYLTYKDSAGNPVELHYEFNYQLFFRRDADDDNDGIPNWYEYWIADEAVAELVDTEYDAGKPCNTRVEKPDGSVYYTSSYGAYSGGADEVSLGMCSARSRSSQTYQFGTFYGTEGIDTCRQVVVHEFTHRNVSWAWREGGAWVGKTNSDFTARGPGDVRDYNDRLPDEYEEAWSSNPELTDTWNLAQDKAPGYKYYGDEEALCIVMADGNKGVAERDWAYPGKQAPEKKAALLALAQAGNSGLPGMSGRSGALKNIENIKTFQNNVYGFGSIASSVQDTNGDGKYDYLKITVPITNVLDEDAYSLIGWITDLQGNEVAWASNTAHLIAGDNTMEIYFDGTTIASSGIDGPYILSRLELRGIDAFDHLNFVAADNAHTTQAYKASDFNSKGVLLNKNYSAQLVDLDQDGANDHLRVSIGLAVDITGLYSVSAWMFDGNQPLASGTVQKTLSQGSDIVSINFPLPLLLKNGSAGPWTLTDVQVRNAGNQMIASGMSVWSTPTYSTGQVATTASLAHYSDTTNDTDGDGVADELHVNLSFNFQGNETRTVSARLTDSGGRLIDTASSTVTPSTGSTTLLSFKGKKISAARAKGPYDITDLNVFKSGTGIELSRKMVFSTSAYAYTDFAAPLIYIDDSLNYEVRDLNGDGLDELVISMTVYVRDSGNANAQAGLYDYNDTLIAQLEQFADGLTAGQANTIRFTVDGQTLQSSEFESPFKLTNLNVYHTGDPLQNWFMSDAGLSIFYGEGTVTPEIGLTQTEVSQLYVSIFNRASEGEGNRFWRTYQPDIIATANAMLDTDAAKNYFGSSLNSDQAFIEHIYLNTLNKTQADDPSGIAYWVGELGKGKSRGEVVATLVGVIKDYAPNGPYFNPNDPKTIAAYNQFINRVTVSNYMADTVEQTPSNWATATQFSPSGLYVTDDPTTVVTAKAAVDAF